MLSKIQLLTAVSLIFIAGSLLTTLSHAQSYFTDCSGGTERNATLIIPSEVLVAIEDEPLVEGDEIAVFGSDGRCAGMAVWNGNKTALSIWADDSITQEKDGLQSDEAFTFRVWRSASGEEYVEGEDQVDSALSACTGPPCRDERLFTADVVYRLGHLEMSRHVSTSIEDPDDVPREFGLASPYPNPFNPRTNFSIAVEKQQHVTIRVYNALGREVATVYDGPMAANSEERFSFEATALPSGLYMIQAHGEHFSDVQTVTLMK